jgi:hypothetical protein
MRDFQEFSYQSKDIEFSDWIFLFTLCLAPLIAHIVSGAPHPSCLSHHRPRWHDRLCHFNPVSIVWRYAAITDRRIRARNWNSTDMAASNALFWTPNGWDGSEEMVVRSSVYAIHIPDKARVIFLSSTSFKTIITTLQGIQAIYSIVYSFRSGLKTFFSVDQVFFPIAILSLLRLCAALWLTEDFAYLYRNQTQMEELGKVPTDEPLNDVKTPIPLQSPFKPASNSSSRAFRATFMLTLLWLWALCLWRMLPLQHQKYTTSSFSVSLFYLIQLAVMISVYGYYFVFGCCTSTIIPCINAVWYKVYTVLVAGAMLLLMVVASIETRRTPCGIYTTISPIYDSQVCSGLITVTPGSKNGTFGLATLYMPPNSTTILQDGQFRVERFTGSCQGLRGYSQIVAPVNLS